MSHSLICVTSHIRSHSLICVKWLTTYLYVSRYTFIYVTWLTTYLYVWHDSYVRRDSFMTKLIHMCNVTCVNMCHVYISENASYAETASLKLYVSFAKEPYKRDDIHTMRFQKTRRIICLRDGWIRWSHSLVWHGTHTNRSRRTYEWVCHTYKWVMSQEKGHIFLCLRDGWIS